MMNKIVGLMLMLTLLRTAAAAQGDTNAAARHSTAGFVTRQRWQLLVDGKPFRFSGANIPWLGQAHYNGKQIYPDNLSIDDALAAAQQMGATVVRAESLGISTGSPLSIEPALGVFNEEAFRCRDYALAAAGERGIRLIVPLTDNWHYSQGGKHNFTDWRGITNPKDEDPADPRERKFYTDTQVIADFEQYISHFLNHVNRYNGLAYKDDPTILCWETGDELSYCPGAWTQTIVDYIKNLDPIHLVMDGKTSLDGYNSYDWSISGKVDIETAHYDVKSLRSDTDFFTGHDKVFVVGEFAWNDPRFDLGEFLLQIAENPRIAGDLYWDLHAHDVGSGYLPRFNDPLALFYPGTTPEMQDRTTSLRSHAYRMSAIPEPPLFFPGQPVITNLTKQAGKNIISWRGAPGADRYTVERSTTGANGPWTVIAERGPSDSDTPWTDPSTPEGQTWYRVRAHNIAGAPGPFSPVYPAVPPGTPH